MSIFQKVTVKSTSPQAVTVTLPDGHDFEWSISEDDPTLAAIKDGDQVILTLTTTHAILNELMSSSNEHAPNTPQTKPVQG
ncbi:MAG: hypothetical protein COW24_02215 [Candidatus Kerfeldbacteria bacterium CG15_BIG_FIL_POST_REV_8_21_14_020_45_12]|uniref:Uncharacterized protein n=1 Tax=Candidatus Kerfeldbacteria bacterium CG15_BIG_FIL_POST_REV_8_21_14_020_45_12 TaxID=2014247 RepID=A0A2M7H492_9BACT|nr:MAG: hypothetical protein COW24_02215 [Candidatus Kerfeldbacteria bacterium CG15_BIG_FIL_POST_REV_8_21_14_020_45_12]PJA94056.1 MAG: hypothetical protein CO132_00290 [Candidatus Kerfeldbacteria bacterium CG_4_9_14_3_um_filter_45_8]